MLAATHYQGNHKLWNIKREMHNPYAGAAGIVLHRRGKFTMGKVKLLLLS
jgi:hypothetical protein